MLASKLWMKGDLLDPKICIKVIVKKIKILLGVRIWYGLYPNIRRQISRGGMSSICGLF